MSFEKLGLQPDRDLDLPPSIPMADEAGADPVLDRVQTPEPIQGVGMFPSAESATQSLTDKDLAKSDWYVDPNDQHTEIA